MLPERKISQCGAYQIMRTLGEGAQAKVKLGYDSINNQYVALKIFKGEKESQKRNLFQLSTEIQILSQLSHTNLIRMITYNPAMIYQRKNGQQLERVVLVLEYASGGELFDYLSKTGPFSEKISRHYFKSLIESIQYLHSKSIAHRDLKPNNLLFNSTFQLKIADFGFSALLHKYQDQTFKTTLGTPGYQAPEILAQNHYDGTKTDIFAAGVILFNLISGAPPFNEAKPNDQRYRQIIERRYERFYTIRSNSHTISLDLQELLNGMLHPDPLQRWSIQQIQQSNWYQGQVMDEDQLLQELTTRKEKVDSANLKILQQGIQRQALRQQGQGVQQVHVPIGRFKCEDDHDLVVLIPKQIKTKQLSLDYIPKNSIILDMDETIILKSLVKNQSKFANLIKIDEDFYKIQVFYENEGNAYNYQIEIIKTQDDIRILYFTQPEHEEGTPYLDYFEFQKNIDEIKNILTEQGQE